MIIPKEVQFEALRVWVKGCRELHAIAFFQWRLMFPNNLMHNPSEIEELIQKRMEILRNEM